MGDVVELGAWSDPETSLRDLRNLQRQIADGEDLGPRVAHIRQIAACLRSLTGGLRRAVDALDPSDEGTAEVRRAAEAVLALATEILAKVEELLCVRAEELRG